MRVKSYYGPETAASVNDIHEVASFFEGEPVRQFVFLDNIHIRGHRLGQAFYNSLHTNQSLRLNGTLFDPFNKDDLQSVLKAIDFLTDPNRK